MHMTRGLGALANPRVLLSLLLPAPPKDPAALAGSVKQEKALRAAGG